MLDQVRNQNVGFLMTRLIFFLQEVTTALEKFAKYHCIWEKDRDEDLDIFLKDDPKLGEFEQKIKYYEELEMEIAAESEYYDVGPIALYTGMLGSAGGGRHFG